MSHIYYRNTDNNVSRQSLRDIQQIVNIYRKQNLSTHNIIMFITLIHKCIDDIYDYEIQEKLQLMLQAFYKQNYKKIEALKKQISNKQFPDRSKKIF